MAHDFPSYKHSVQRLLSWPADTAVALKFASPFEGDHLSAGLALWVGKVSTCPRSQILEERDRSHKLLHTEHLRSVFLSLITIGHPGAAKAPVLQALVRTF